LGQDGEHQGEARKRTKKKKKKICKNQEARGKVIRKENNSVGREGGGKKGRNKERQPGLGKRTGKEKWTKREMRSGSLSEV